MFALNFLVVYSLLVWCSHCSAYNVDVKAKAKYWKGTNGSYFGFSVALHGRTKAENIVLVGAPFDKVHDQEKVEGDVYTCKVNSVDEDCTAHVLQDLKRSGAKPKQMFGASIYTSGKFKHVVICAPRYTEKTDDNNHYMYGKCVWYDKQLQRLIDLIPCKQRAKESFGYCEAGFDVTYHGDGKTILMGALGTQKGTGALVTATDHDSTPNFKFTSIDQNVESDYLGYSVTNGNFYTDEQNPVGGKPRADLTGKVVIYDSKNAVRFTLQPPIKEKYFMYFGLSVCAVDINADGFSDLLVGAPFYSDKRDGDAGDQGRVYVYISRVTSHGRALQLEARERDDPGLRGNNQAGARFGWAIARAGDLNDDDYEDVIIGAPHDGPDSNGAIYIYHGSSTGKMDNPQQRITAADMKAHFHVDFNQFGYAVSGNVDIDDNEYPDIAIGCWKSDRVVLLRTRPVMDVIASLTLSKKEIPIEGNITNCKNGSMNRQCLNATACFRYLGKGVDGEQVLDYTFKLDETVNAKRVYFEKNGEKEYVKTGRLPLKTKDNDFCVDFHNIFVEGKNELQNNLGTGKDIEFLIEYKLQSKPRCNSELCPILDQSQTPSIRQKATLILNCSDNTCDYDLSVKLSAEPKNITIGKTEKVIVVITLGNKAEKSYNPDITITHDASLHYERIVVVNKDVKFQRRTLDTGNQSTTEKFRFQGVLESDQTVVLKLQFSSKEVKGATNQVGVAVSTEASSGQESNKTDNKDSFFFLVKREVLLSIVTKSVPKAITYPSAPEGIANIHQNASLVDFSSVNASSVGTTVKTVFILKNDGKSDLQSLTFFISFPFRESEENNQQKYIVYPAAIKFPPNYGQCDKSQMNPEALKNVEESRTRRDTEVLTPRNRKSATIRCQVDELKTSEPFTVELTIIVWLNTIKKYYPKDLVLQFSARATYKDPLRNNKEITEGPTSLDVHVAAQSADAKKKTTPVWIIIVAVLGAILFLAIIMFALFKFGFFKRNRPPKDISSPQTDDAFDVPT